MIARATNADRFWCVRYVKLWRINHHWLLAPTTTHVKLVELMNIFLPA